MTHTVSIKEKKIVPILLKLTVRLGREYEVNLEINFMDGDKPIPETDKKVEIYKTSYL